MIKKCLGCGAIMQTQDKNKIGYINEEKYMDAKYCERCFKLINYGEYKSVVSTGEEYIDIYKNINKTNDLVLFLVDIFNLNSSIDMVNKYIDNNIILVITKYDIIPKSVNPNKIKSKLNELKLNKNIVDIVLISSKTNYREPDVVAKYSSTGYDMDSRLKTLGIGAKTTHEFLNQLEKEFNNMVASVEKYGGFYIGRYETGNINQDTPVIQKGNTNISSQTWYNMYKRCKNIRGANTNVETGMIWGNQWDRTLMWLIETGSKTKEQIADDSTSWGNYYNATFEYVNSSGSTATKNENSSTRIPTGSAEYTKANNIYDLAGNVRDWTMEASSTVSRVYRGSYYDNGGGYYPAGSRNLGNPTYSGSGYGCRSALYIK